MHVFLSKQRTSVLIFVGGVVAGSSADEFIWFGACDGGACVEFSATEETVAMRSSTNPSAVVTMTRTEWQAFLAGAKDGNFDDL